LISAYQAIRVTYDNDGTVASEAFAAKYSALEHTRPRRVLEGHTDTVWSVAFNHDGTRIVTASADGTARLWDGEGNPITILDGHTGRFGSAAFNHDGTRIVTISINRTARLWWVYGSYDEMLAEAERKLQLVLSAAECQQYFKDFDAAFCVGWGNDQ
jgi:WD40 repeat protein